MVALAILGCVNKNFNKKNVKCVEKWKNNIKNDLLQCWKGIIMNTSKGCYGKLYVSMDAMHECYDAK